MRGAAHDHEDVHALVWVVVDERHRGEVVRRAVRQRPLVRGGLHFDGPDRPQVLRGAQAGWLTLLRRGFTWALVKV